MVNRDFLKTLKTELNIKAMELKTLKEGEFKYMPAVGRPGKILCIGLNYKRHIEETKGDLPESPVIFSKFSNPLRRHLKAIPFYSQENPL